MDEGAGGCLLRFDPGAGVGETSVERLAASAVSGGVGAGWVGAGWRRSAMGLREAHPEEYTQRTQKAQSARRKNVGEYKEKEKLLNSETKTRSFESVHADMLSDVIFKRPPAS